MRNFIVYRAACLFCFAWGFYVSSHAQVASNVIKGHLLDETTQQPIVGGNIVIQNQGATSGTITDPNGYFELTVSEPFPVVLQISSLTYEARELVLHDPKQDLILTLTPQLTVDQSVVVRARASDDEVRAASKWVERSLESPVSIYNLGVEDLIRAPSRDFFTSTARVKEVQINSSSLTFNSINTRGFADAQNWRFIQYIDGMEMNTPGLNYSLGNMSGTSMLDIRNLEIVPGAGSALYGPNAYNGLLSMETKNPFDYPGLSAYFTAGITSQKAAGSNPVYDMGVRYALPLNDKFAVKINLSYLSAHDWEADDQSYHITTERIPLSEQLLQLPRTHPNFDAVNVYGDEVQVPVDLMGTGETTLINRTGIPERDLVNYEVNNLKLNTSLHYKLNEDLEASYHLHYLSGDAVLRHTTIYPFVNISHTKHKLELKGNQFFIRGYHTREDANDSYQMLATGAFIQSLLKPNEVWAADYAGAFQGFIPEVAAGDHAAARAYADRDIPGPESEQFQQLRSLTLNNPDITTGGSKFIDQTRMTHLEGNYNLTPNSENWDVQTGGSLRKYLLKSDGQLFNDGPTGFNDAISIWEYGLYTQLSHTLADDHLKLGASIRFDKNQNFEGRFTPRLSAVLTLGEQRQHNFRLSAQSGFRNPASQETYIALDVGPAILLGGTQDNIQNYQYQRIDGTFIDGETIHQELITLASLQAFLGSGGTDPTLLQRANLDFLRQERIQTYEIGYRAQLNPRWWVDVNVYRNSYRDFVTRVTAFSLLVNRAFSVYTNVPETLTSTGWSMGSEYETPEGLTLGANLTKSSFDADEAVENNPGFLPGFNLPGTRFNLYGMHPKVVKNLGFSLNYYYSSAYTWQSPFGQGEIDSHGVIDASLMLGIPEINTHLKIGASNLFNSEYQSIYGGPRIGAQYYLTLIFDEYLR